MKQLGQIWAEKNDSDHPHGANIHEWPPQIQVREMPVIYPEQPVLDVFPDVEHG